MRRTPGGEGREAWDKRERRRGERLSDKLRVFVYAVLIDVPVIGLVALILDQVTHRFEP